MLLCCYFVWYFFFFKQKTAYEMRISDWSSDVCSSDLDTILRSPAARSARPARSAKSSRLRSSSCYSGTRSEMPIRKRSFVRTYSRLNPFRSAICLPAAYCRGCFWWRCTSFIRRSSRGCAPTPPRRSPATNDRSEEHTSELQSLMRISYAVFCLKKKKRKLTHHN